jgi:sigma-54 dependent transcriptional regulator, acetoin dehydrogenase operon transcriptional activator AcoR
MRQQLKDDYWSAWQQFVLHGTLEEERLPLPVVQAWQRCARLGLNPQASLENSTRRKGNARVSQDLLRLARPALEDLYQFAGEAECVMVFADADAWIADLVGGQRMLQELEQAGLFPEALWNEEQQGANALSLALRESFPTYLAGAMHYLAALHPFYTAAAPVHDLLGQAVGVLGVVGHREHYHPHTLGMITAAAQALSNQLQVQVWLNNANDLLAELKTISQALPEGVLLLRRDGIISQMNAPAGVMLGLLPERANGRRLRDILPIPVMLARALERRETFTDEEILFETSQGRVICLCSLKPIAGTGSKTGLENLMNPTGLQISPQTTADGFVLVLRNIERVRTLVHRLTGARARLTFANVIGENGALRSALLLAQRAAKSNSTILLCGETGTGKEIFAQSIHNHSQRSSGPFVAINCAAIPRELINTELFGYDGGSFTGADRQGRLGKFEQASGGTLFLDEIGDMPLDLQTSLLRAIETHTITRIGGQRTITVDVRIIAATHKDLQAEVQRGTFRSDLYYRLNVLSIVIPALHQRADDIPLLVGHFLERQSQAQGRALTITQEAIQALQAFAWPGNVRELENVLERVTYLLMPRNAITLNDLPSEIRQYIQSRPLLQLPEPRLTAKPPYPVAFQGERDLKKQSQQAELAAILRACQEAEGHMAQAATLLGISRTTLWRKMLRYGVVQQIKK